MTSPTALSPTIIRVESSADFLALLPALTGYIVANSLLVVLFSGNRSIGALRFDLPASEELRIGGDLAASVSAGVSQLAKVDGVALAIVTDRYFTERGGPPWRNLARRLERTIARTGLVLRDSCCVAANGWSSYLPPESSAMRPLSEITQSVAGLEASIITDEPIISLAKMSALPTLNVERATEIRHALDDTLARPSRFAFTGPRLVALIACSSSRATAKDAARLAYAAGSPTGWFRLVCATVASGVVERDQADTLKSDRISPADEANYLAECFDRDGVFEDAAEATQAGGPLEHALVRYASTQPDRERSRRAITLMGEVTQHVPREYQSGLRCLLAWMWWWSGLASIAAQHVEEALRIEPGHHIATMLGRLIDDGMIPPWALGEPLVVR